jgi:putative ATP-dependent endonuclease of OLD family
MYLASLKARDFRKLRKADLSFQRTLNVIVGENNGGKTAVIDAIRTVLGTRTFELDDFTYDYSASPGSRYCESSEIEVTFTDLSRSDEPAFLLALVRSARQGQYDAQLRATASRASDEVSRTLEAGPPGSTARATDVLRARRVIYLPPLRDPGGDRGLRPGRLSQLANLLRRTANDRAKQEVLERIAKTANAKLKKTAAVKDATDLLTGNLLALTGPDYAIRPDLGFVEPEFDRLAASLEAMAENMQISMNGLGSSNLYYIAAVLADLSRDKTIRYRCLLIEEPEAHLHPHYQVLLLRFLQSTAADLTHPVQVFVTTHSPILASQAARAGILPLVERPDGTHVANPIAEKATGTTANRIRQYLDATRSELFFARRLILIEGDGELFLIPALAKHIGVNLGERGVSVISAAGLNFKVFIPFVKGSVLNIPVAIVTDKDPDKNRPDTDGEPGDSRYLKSLRASVAGDERIQIFASKRTLEYDIAIPTANAKPILEAMRHVHPRKVDAFLTTNDSLEGADFAEAFHTTFFRPGKGKKPASKADFALELAIIIESGKAPGFEVPPYLKKAIRYAAPHRPGNA